MSGWTLCIDFGTGYSKAAAAPADAWTRFDPALVRPLTLGGGGDGNPFLIESAVFVDQSSIALGAEALRRAADHDDKKRQALRSFKTLLSASDLERALTLNVPGSIDPHRAFQQRDLIVLYLAYLDRAIERAIAADPVLAGSGAVQRRYATPAWRTPNRAAQHAIVVRLFHEARLVQQKLGDALLAPAGVPIDAAEGAVAEARRAPPAANTMGMIFEATAAAAYSSIGLQSVASHFVVIDMGAGTTDVTALVRGEGLEELPNGRMTLTRAGDFIDRVLLNVIIDKANAKTQAQQAKLWRDLAPAIRNAKEDVFSDGKAAVRDGGKTIVITLRDIERDKDFKQFVKMVQGAYQNGLDAAIARAKAHDARDVQAIAVGGGADAPFIRDLLRAKTIGKVRVSPRPATPDWAHTSAFSGNLAPIFPQLAIAIGGALAPDNLLAAR